MVCDEAVSLKKSAPVMWTHVTPGNGLGSNITKDELSNYTALGVIQLLTIPELGIEIFAGQYEPSAADFPDVYVSFRVCSSGMTTTPMACEPMNASVVTTGSQLR